MKALFLLFVFISGSAFAQFTDPQDGQLDASEWLLERKGFLPVPIVITEPAVGYGAGAALLFFRESMGERAAKAKETGRFSPPDIYGVALAATENGSKFAGVGGMVTFLNDQWRYRGGVGLPNANLDFYGEGGTAAPDDLKLGYNLDGIGSTQQMLRRLGDGDNFIGLRWIYLDLEARFESNRPLPAFLPQSQTIRSSGIGPVFEHDSRDNIFTPSRGWYANLEALFYSPDIGSDQKFEVYRGRAYGYLPLSSAFVLGGRLDVRNSQGDVPFYQLPYVDLRGIPVARYQDQSAGAAEAELRWNVTPRWALVGFLGAGRAWGSSASFSDADSVTSGGVGFRYLVARRLGIYMGLDVAVGPEDTAFYIQMGSAWR